MPVCVKKNNLRARFELHVEKRKKDEKSKKAKKGTDLFTT